MSQRVQHALATCIGNVATGASLGCPTAGVHLDTSKWVHASYAAHVKLQFWIACCWTRANSSRMLNLCIARAHDKLRKSFSVSKKIRTCAGCSWWPFMFLIFVSSFFMFSFFIYFYIVLLFFILFDCFFLFFWFVFNFFYIFLQFFLFFIFCFFFVF